MSFVELLKKSREQAHQHVQEIANKIKEVNSTDDKLDIIEIELLSKRKVDIDNDGQSHPAQYFTGLDEKTKRERERVIEQRQAEGITGDELYEDLPGDEDSKTKPSKYTNHPKVKKIREEMKDSSKDEFIRAAAKVSGVSKPIIEEVYDKGLKAHATSGHRPGATAQQWAIARVYAFLFFPDSGARKVDQHLWDEHRKNKKSITLRQKLRQELLNAYGLRKKLFHKDKFAKHTYKLLNENKLYLKDFEFCFNNLEGLNKNSLNYKLLGGDVMLLVQKHIKNNLTLEQTLNQEVEE